ncbi:hypothetical protein PMI01_03741 [Caulobacter sp. AP07]|uniref:hypothetical protein n=1 Tax=Caulobacter sp. AP07 TaxID=1144304 RepID=UPI00027201BC|nr:hypothetical protein [Caulobacter sp. AP07]EJL27616.1 hypothetical protein PMI01_03741 [Caulobacter sp. AP07]
MTQMDLGRTRVVGVTMIAMVLALTGAAQAQDRAQYPIKKPASAPPPAQTPDKKPDDPDKPAEGWMAETRKKSVEIGTQPARDVGVMKREIPPILDKAREDPYSLKGLKTCKQLAAEVTDLNLVLGPDYKVGNEVRENKAGKLAEAGGKSVINAIIPFRGVVRELTGAAPADRRLNAALDAGYARRGFLRGVHAKQGCRTTF